MFIRSVVTRPRRTPSGGPRRSRRVRTGTGRPVQTSLLSADDACDRTRTVAPVVGRGIRASGTYAHVWRGSSAFPSRAYVTETVRLRAQDVRPIRRDTYGAYIHVCVSTGTCIFKRERARFTGNVSVADGRVFGISPLRTPGAADARRLARLRSPWPTGGGASTPRG